MKRILLIPLSFMLSISTFAVDNKQPHSMAHVKTQFETIQRDLQSIRQKLQKEKLSTSKASILLSNLQAQQNQIIIYQK